MNKIQDITALIQCGHCGKDLKVAKEIADALDEVNDAFWKGWEEHGKAVKKHQKLLFSHYNPNGYYIIAGYAGTEKGKIYCNGECFQMFSEP